MLTARATKCTRTIFASVMLLASPLNAESLPVASEIVATGLHFPEGTIFVGNTPYFVDYSTSDVLRIVLGNVEKVWHQDGCGANSLQSVRVIRIVPPHRGYIPDTRARQITSVSTKTGRAAQ